MNKNTEIAMPAKGDKSALNSIVRQLVNDPAFLVQVQRELAKLIVFDAWTEQEHSNGFERLEPGKNDARVQVYEATDNEWYYRVGFGVIGLAGFSNETPFKSSSEAMDYVDKMLGEQADIVAA